ncbi:hypothetical protein DH09_00660 (plasmid) [Bacillaceae bacterium JMAK1]|nr:hypothetical protein DH09_00660 [Bacillaceae bacterium JMAK1]
MGKTKGFITSFALGAVLFATVFPQSAGAETIDSDDLVDGHITEEELQKAKEEGDALRPHVNSNPDGTIDFDVEGALEAGVDEDLVHESEEVYNEANEKMSSATGEFSTLSSCGGVTRYDNQGFMRGDIYLNSCDASYAANIVGGSGTLSQLVGFLPGGVPVAVASGVFHGGLAFLLNHNNSNNTGIVIRMVEAPFDDRSIPYWVRSQ